MISSGGKREGEGKKVHHNSNTLYWVKSHFESSMRCYVCCEWVKKFLSFFLEGPDFSPDTPRRGRIWPTPFVRSGAGSWRSLDVEAMTGVTSSRLQRNVTIPSALPPTLYVPSHPIEASELRWCQEGGKEGADVWHEWQGEETTEREREMHIDFVLYFTVFKDFSSTLTPTHSQEMFTLRLITETTRKQACPWDNEAFHSDR